MIGIVGDELVEVQLSSDRMLEYILTSDNLNRAYRQVKANKGSGGIDRMDVDKLLPYLREHKDEITESLKGGRYRPNPVRRVDIPKDGGKTRQLGIPTVVDRVIQQSIASAEHGVRTEILGGKLRLPPETERAPSVAKGAGNHQWRL